MPPIDQLLLCHRGNLDKDCWLCRESVVSYPVEDQSCWCKACRFDSKVSDSIEEVFLLSRCAVRGKKCSPDFPAKLRRLRYRATDYACRARRPTPVLPLIYSPAGSRRR